MEHYEIEWLDSAMATKKRWRSRKKQMKLAGKKIAGISRSVGYLLGVDDETVYLAESHNDALGNWFGAQAILKANIISVTKLTAGVVVQLKELT